jgi:DNA-binding response OmpR family regulator
MTTAQMASAHAHRVVLVDDDAELRHALVYFLNTAHIAVDAVPDIARAREALAYDPLPCAIVVDVHLGAESGWTLIAELQETPHLAAIPVVLLSGAIVDAARAIRLGVRTFLTKPADPHAIAAAVAEHCHP